MKLSTPFRRKREQGYILIYLTLVSVLLSIAALGWIERVDFQIKRDREEELIHRGVQYSRAIRRFMKKFGRYPSRIEDLESTNNIRFLRKRYKDPITGKDFRLLHMNDVQISFSPGAASGLPPAPADSSPANQLGAPGALNQNAAGRAGPGPSSIPGNQQTGGQTGANGQQAGTADDSAPDQSAQGASGTENAQDNGNPGTPVSQLGSGNNGPTYGGLPIIGVASRSKDKTIREFNKKNHYNQWQFIYDPSTDRGGLLTTPNQPALQNSVQMNNTPTQQNSNQNQSPGFAPGGMSGPGMNPPQQPPSTTPDQQ